MGSTYSATAFSVLYAPESTDIAIFSAGDPRHLASASLARMFRICLEPEEVVQMVWRKVVYPFVVLLVAFAVWGAEEKALLTGHTGPIWGLDFSPDGRYLVSAGGCFDKVVRLWDVELKMEAFPFRGSIDRVMAVSFNADGKTIASMAPMERAVRLWDVDTGECAKLESCAGALVSVLFSLDWGLLVTGSLSGRVCLWRVTEGGYELLGVLEGPEDEARGLAFSPGAGLLAAASEDGKVYIWDTETGAVVRVFTAHKRGARGVSFSPDGGILASCGADYAVKLWDVAGWKLLRVLEGHRWYVNAVTFSPDGTVLASGASNGEIILWDPASRERIDSLKAHEKAVTGLDFNPDGIILASCSADRTIVLWYLEKD